MNPPPRRRRRAMQLFALVALGSAALLYWGNDVLIALENEQPSRSHGTPASGSLQHGKRLPSRGPNFRTYSALGSLLGRTAVHGQIRAAVLGAYAELERTRPELRFVYGETGWPGGGPFAPHRTHQNGLAVDFFVPVRNADGEVAMLPTWPWTRFGYDIEFDERGSWRDYRIDHDALALHLAALDRAAAAHGLEVASVILAPESVRSLGRTASASRLHGVPFSTRRPWVRHDEHYHVLFRIRTPANDRTSSSDR